MKFSAAAAFIALVPSVLGLTVNTPTNVVQCQPIQLSWTAGQPPYFLSLIPAGQVSASPIKTFPEQQGLTYTWLVDLQANTNFNVALKDNSGNTVYSSIVTIVASGDSSCLNTSVAESGSGGSGPTSSGAAAPSGSSSSGTGTGTSTSSASSSTSSSKNGSAGRASTVSTFGIAGLMGLVGAALF